MYVCLSVRLHVRAIFFGTHGLVFCIQTVAKLQVAVMVGIIDSLYSSQNSEINSQYAVS